MKLVIDTSIIIDYLRGGIKWEEFLKGVDRESELFLPTGVVFELYSGQSTKKPSVSENILNLLKKFEAVDLNAGIAKRAGELCRDIGRHISPLDYIIAASALDMGGTVVTLNRKHFEQIPGLAVYSGI